MSKKKNGGQPTEAEVQDILAEYQTQQELRMVFFALAATMHRDVLQQFIDNPTRKKAIDGRNKRRREKMARTGKQFRNVDIVLSVVDEMADWAEKHVTDLRELIIEEGGGEAETLAKLSTIIERLQSAKKETNAAEKAAA